MTRHAPSRAPGDPHGTPTADSRALELAAAALAASAGVSGAVTFRGAPWLGGAYPVGAFASAAVATTALALADLVEHDGPVTVDAALAGAWFRAAVRPRAEQPSPWDALTGDYRAADGWIRLHMNAPHHRADALGVLGLAPADPANGTPAADPDRDTVARAVAPFGCDALETAVVEAGGAAARVRSVAEWAEHPQGAALAAEPLIAVETTGLARPDQPFPPGVPERPLVGVRVLDLTRVLAGPVATRALAMLGADVLRIDPPDWSEPAVEPDMTLGKRCARVDAHTVEGRSELVALVAEADVLVHGYRPGALAGLGLDDETLRVIRPGLVEVQLDAWGYSGPWAGRRGFDSLVQLATGIADPATASVAAPAPSEGDAGRASDAPIALPVQALDHATGWLAATAALRAVAHARRTGEGSRSRLSLARTALELERLRDALGPAEAHPEPRVASTPLDTPWGLADVLASPLEVGGVRLHTVHPPRHLGADEPHWLVDERHDEAEAERVAPRSPRPVIMQPTRAIVWAILSGALVWASQGLLETLGAALLAQPDIGARWWTNPGWAVGSAAQTVVLALGWITLSRRLAVGPTLAVTTALGLVAHTIAATLVYTGSLPASGEEAWNLGSGLALALAVSGAALVQLALPVLLALTRPFLGRATARSRAIDPRYARRGRARGRRAR
ncbi:MAG: CoA transferase [Actinomycetes bacterium]